MQHVRAICEPDFRSVRAMMTRIMSRPTDTNRVKLVRKRLDADAVLQHLVSVTEHGGPVELRIKGGDSEYSEASAEELSRTGEQLIAGAIIAIQLRYAENGEWWCDTLMRAPKQYRLVRMRMED